MSFVAIKNLLNGFYYLFFFSLYADYGVQHVKVLYDRFSKTLCEAHVDKVKLVEEWQMLKCLVYQRYLLHNFHTNNFQDMYIFD